MSENSKLLAGKSDNPRSRGGQRLQSDNSVGRRILEALEGRSRKWLAEQAGMPESTISDYIARGIAKAEPAVAIARALNVSIDWLLTGSQKQNSTLVAVEKADWIEIPEFDLRELTDEIRGPQISSTPFRRDWLNRNLGTARNIWLARLPADYRAGNLRADDLVLCRDVEPGEVQDGAVYIVRIAGNLTVARIDSLLDTGRPRTVSSQDRRLGFRHIATPGTATDDEGRATLVARVLAVPIHRL